MKPPYEFVEVLFFMVTTQKLSTELKQFPFLQGVDAELIADYITRKYTLTEIQQPEKEDKPIVLLPISEIVNNFDKVVSSPLPENYRIHPKESRCLMMNNIVICSIDLLKELPYERLKKHKNSLAKFQEHEYLGDYYEIVDKIYIEKHLNQTDDGRVTDITNPTETQLFGGQ